ncbi:MAG: hypothetical protein ABGY41_13290 [Candidatus Poribacteria bacterium]
MRGLAVLLCALCLLAVPATAAPDERPDTPQGRPKDDPTAKTADEPTYLLIVNDENDLEEISPDDLAQVFLGKVTLWDDNTRIRPAMLPDDDDVTRDFASVIVERTARQFRNYWRKRLFAGRGAGPKTFRSTAKVIQFVIEYPGAIGVITASEYVETPGIRPLSIATDSPKDAPASPAPESRED